MKNCEKRWITGLALLAVLFSCGQKEIVPEPTKEPDTNVLTGITVTPEKASLKAGETLQLSVAPVPAGTALPEILWSSTRSSVVTVDDKGLVTGVAEGSASIRAQTADKKFSQYCVFTVTASSGNPGTPTPTPTSEDTRVFEDSGATLPDYPTYNAVGKLSVFPRVDIDAPVENIQRLAEGEYTWVEGTVTFKDPAKMYSDVTELGKLKMRIRGRGNTSWNAEGGIKHSYKIKLEEHNKVFGMKGDKDWLLLADVQDPTMLRNAIALRTARMVSMPWTPKYRTVEVYFKGQYGGCYLLTEAKEVDRENKIPITVVADGKTDGGYLLELDNKQDFDRYFESAYFLRKIKFKDPEEPEEAQQQYITGYVNEVERLLSTQSFDPESGYRSMMNVDTFINNYIVQELSMNVDGGMRLSTYFAKDSDTKLFMPMVWDFDLAFGNASYIGTDFDLPWYGDHNNGPEGWFIKIRGGDFRHGDVQGKTETYYQFLFKDPTFVQELKARWNEVKPRLDKIPAFMDKMKEYNHLAYDHNVSGGMNPRASGWYSYPPDSFASWEEAVEWLKDWYIRRLAWLDQNINAL